MIALLVSVLALAVAAFAAGAQYGESRYKRYLRESASARRGSTVQWTPMSDGIR